MNAQIANPVELASTHFKSHAASHPAAKSPRGANDAPAMLVSPDVIEGLNAQGSGYDTSALEGLYGGQSDIAQNTVTDSSEEDGQDESITECDQDIDQSFDSYLDVDGGDDDNSDDYLNL